jgi:hypothetical protein
MNFMRSFETTRTLCVILTAVIIFSGVVNAAVPANDNCANATAISEVENLAFSTANATFDGPGVIMNSKNIWYVYTASCTGQVTISLCGSAYDTLMAVYSGSTCPPTYGRLVAYNDDFCDFQSQVTINAVAGSKYLIEVGGYQNYNGSGVLTIRCPNTVENDNCASAISVGAVTNLAFDTTNATFDGPGLCNVNHSPNIWFLYTATSTTSVTVSLCGSSFDTILSVYEDATCPPQAGKMLGCNDDFCNHQSQVTFSGKSGKQYLIEVAGFESTDKGEGLLTISAAALTPNHYDLGDAPDSVNNAGKTMTAYSTPKTVNAHFPTVFANGTIAGPYGPIHLDPKKVAYLGSAVTFENEADRGLDADVVNNIVPATNVKNQDGGDDGIVFPVAMPTGSWTTITYKVYVVDPNYDMYVNIWCDFNRDGDWNDDSTTDPNMVSNRGKVSEWAVKNQLLYHLPAGQNTITTPGFLCWNPASGEPNSLWMRITLSEVPWKGGSGAAGSGPATGYQYGETEDYYYSPTDTCPYCEDLNGDEHVNLNDLYMYIEQWLDNCQ